MYLTAQRVIAPRTERTGINAFLHLHGGRSWHVPPNNIPDGDPGTLDRKHVEVDPPAGNRVRSYIDIVAPDEISAVELGRYLRSFLRRSQWEPLPWESVEGPCLFRVDMEEALARAGGTVEVGALLTAAARLLQRD